jgi:hypothetical protein
MEGEDTNPPASSHSRRNFLIEQLLPRRSAKIRIDIFNTQDLDLAAVGLLTFVRLKSQQS